MMKYGISQNEAKLLYEAKLVNLQQQQQQQKMCTVCDDWTGGWEGGGGEAITRIRKWRKAWKWR